MISLVFKYLEVSKLSFHKEAFEDLFLSHPNYPSVYAITDSLNVLSIENIAIKIPKEQLTELPNSFLALFHEDLVLVDKEMSSIKITTNTGENKVVSFNAFYEGWNGIIIAIEPNANPMTESKKINLNLLIYSVPILLLIALSISYHSYAINNFLLLLTSLVGLLISVFIIQEKWGIKNDLVSKFCNINPNTSCDSVIKSDKNKNNKWIQFSDLPLLFFGVNTLSIIIQPEQSSLIVGFLSFLALPIIVYSIWLQKFQIKKWCVLCLAVSFLIVMQSLVFGSATTSFSTILSAHPFVFLFSSVLFSSLWFFVKPILETKIKIEKELITSKKFKRSYKMFDFLTKEIPTLSGFHQLQGLHFGNKNADIQLTIIISPSCGHCHKAFADAFELVSKFNQRISLNVLFNINPENDQNPYRVVVERLLTINNTQPEKRVEAISDWHIQKMELEQWKEKWTINAVDMISNQQIHQQYNWCLVNELNYTPIIIINNKLFPGEYEINDLKYFLNDFSQEMETVESNVLTTA